MKTAVVIISDFPSAPNAFAFAEAAIKNIMAADVRFGPMAFGTRRAILTLDYKRPDVVVAFTGNTAIAERQMHIHAMLILRLVIIEPGPRAGRIQLIAHSPLCSKFEGRKSKPEGVILALTVRKKRPKVK
jgi:hypothetical protein